MQTKGSNCIVVIGPVSNNYFIAQNSPRSNRLRPNGLPFEQAPKSMRAAHLNSTRAVVRLAQTWRHDRSEAAFAIGHQRFETDGATEYRFHARNTCMGRHT